MPRNRRYAVEPTAQVTFPDGSTTELNLNDAQITLTTDDVASFAREYATTTTGYVRAEPVRNHTHTADTISTGTINADRIDTAVWNTYTGQIRFAEPADNVNVGLNLNRRDNNQKIEVKIHLDNGTILNGEVNRTGADSEIMEIGRYGYRHDDGAVVTYYPPQKIVKITYNKTSR